MELEWDWEKLEKEQSLIVQQRNLPARGFRPSVMLLGMAGIMTYGFWKVGKGIREQKYVRPIPEPELKKE